MDMHLYGIGGLVVMALDIWAIINIIQSGASNGTKVLWILLVVILPVAGLILWLLLGPRGSRAS